MNDGIRRAVFLMDVAKFLVNSHLMFDIEKPKGPSSKHDKEKKQGIKPEPVHQEGDSDQPNDHEYQPVEIPSFKSDELDFIIGSFYNFCYHIKEWIR